jgi:hypothetical protein
MWSFLKFLFRYLLPPLCGFSLVSSCFYFFGNYLTNLNIFLFSIFFVFAASFLPGFVYSWIVETWVSKYITNKIKYYLLSTFLGASSSFWFFHSSINFIYSWWFWISVVTGLASSCFMFLPYNKEDKTQ